MEAQSRLHVGSEVLMSYWACLLEPAIDPRTPPKKIPNWSSSKRQCAKPFDTL